MILIWQADFSIRCAVSMDFSSQGIFLLLALWQCSSQALLNRRQGTPFRKPEFSFNPLLRCFSPCLQKNVLLQFSGSSRNFSRGREGQTMILLKILVKITNFACFGTFQGGDNHPHPPLVETLATCYYTRASCFKFHVQLVKVGHIFPSCLEKSWPEHWMEEKHIVQGYDTLHNPHAGFATEICAFSFWTQFWQNRDIFKIPSALF